MLTPEQKAQRLKYITGTDAGIICGVSPFCTPYKLWEYKTGRDIEPDISNNPSVKAGIMLEGAIRDWLSNEIKKGISEPNGMIVSPYHPFMAANIDGDVYLSDCENGIREIVEIKTSSSATGWGPQGSLKVPPAYFLQAVHYMSVTGAQCCYMAVLIRGVDFRWYKLPHCPLVESFLISKEQEFYDCVKNNTMPEIPNKQWAIDVIEAYIMNYSNDLLSNNLEKPLHTIRDGMDYIFG